MICNRHTERKRNDSTAATPCGTGGLPDEFNHGQASVFAALRRDKHAWPRTLHGAIYLKPDKDGNHVCSGCGNIIFSTNDQFDSHCGWPSFTAPAGQRYRINSAVINLESERKYFSTFQAYLLIRLDNIY